MIDDLLAKSILAFLVEIDENKKLVDGFNAPLGAFSARILAAYALGILEETEYQECERIRKIRNEFAHNVKASFKSQKIIDITSTLHFSAKDDPTKGQRLPTKGKFTTAAVALILNLTNRPRYASDRRLKAQIWAY
ncbi:MAG: MltR family transcriptional regulator [Acidobacteriaceae bacterium]|jgi:DNA-binding MltR family transcriptional regulator